MNALYLLVQLVGTKEDRSLNDWMNKKKTDAIVGNLADIGGSLGVTAFTNNISDICNRINH